MVSETLCFSCPAALSDGHGLCWSVYDLACRLQTLVNYALKAERDLWGVLDGPWDGPDYANHRRAWSSQVCFYFDNSANMKHFFPG